MGESSRLLMTYAAMTIVVVSLCNGGVAAATERVAVSEAVQNEVELLGDRRKASSAGGRLAEQGAAIVPELITALEDTLSALSQYDPRNLGDAKDRYTSLLYRQSMLMGLISLAGSAEQLDRLASLGRLIHPDSLVVPNYYDMLDRLGGHAEADDLAAEIIADPASDQMLLVVSLSRFQGGAPAAVIDSVAQHLDAESSLARATAYQVLVHAGRGDAVRKKLINEVDALEYTGTANFRMLYALALIEEPATYLPRVEALRLRPAVKEAVVLTNVFQWSSNAERESRLPEILKSKYDAVVLDAIEFILEEGRVDLLLEHNLVLTTTQPIEFYRALIPGFDTMTRERLLRYMAPKEVDELLAKRSQPVTPRLDSRVRRTLERSGYGLEKRGNDIVIVPPEDGV